MVLIEAVRHLAPRLFAVNPHPLVVELAAEAGLELLWSAVGSTRDLPTCTRPGR